MAFTPVGSVTIYDSASSDTAVLTKPTGVADGDIMFAFLTKRNANQYAGGVPTDWTLLAQTAAGGNFNGQVFYKIAASEGTDYTWTYFNPGLLQGRMIAYRGGFVTSDPIDVVSNTDYITSNTTCRAASMTVTDSNSPLVFFGTVDETSAITFTKPSVPSTDWVEDYDGGSTSPDSWKTICSMVWSSSGATGTMDATMSASQGAKHAFAVALTPLSAIKTVNGLAKASVKTYNGLAIASVKSINGLQ